MKLEMILDFAKKHLSTVNETPTFTPIRVQVGNGDDADAEILAIADNTIILGTRGTVRLPFHRLGTRSETEIVIQMPDGSPKSAFSLARGVLEGTTKTLLIQV
jgi:hypothetical protein